jgi:hypothetical protein
MTSETDAEFVDAILDHYRMKIRAMLKKKPMISSRECLKELCISDQALEKDTYFQSVLPHLFSIEVLTRLYVKTKK